MKITYLRDGKRQTLESIDKDRATVSILSATNVPYVQMLYYDKVRTDNELIKIEISIADAREIAKAIEIAIAKFWKDGKKLGVFDTED